MAIPVIVFWAIGVALIVVQTTLLEHLPVWLARPDLLFVLVAFLAYRFAWIPGIAVVFSLTWMVDVLVQTPTTQDGWWLLRSTTDHAVAGMSSQRMTIWDASGRAVANAMQSVAIFG